MYILKCRKVKMPHNCSLKFSNLMGRVPFFLVILHYFFLTSMLWFPMSGHSGGVLWSVCPDWPLKPFDKRQCLYGARETAEEAHWLTRLDDGCSGLSRWCGMYKPPIRFLILHICTNWLRSVKILCVFVSWTWRLWAVLLAQWGYVDIQIKSMLRINIENWTEME